MSFWPRPYMLPIPVLISLLIPRPFAMIFVIDCNVPKEPNPTVANFLNLENILQGNFFNINNFETNFNYRCCLIELFTDGQPPFDFSQLLAYRSGEFSVDKHLEKIEDIGVRVRLGNTIPLCKNTMCTNNFH